MKKSLIVVACVFGLAAAMPAAAKPSHRVSSHVTKKGTYVAPHRATNPDRSRMNNYSTKGNSNPYTGKAGTKRP